jgi:predicted RNase H-like HicB family nuclease
MTYYVAIVEDGGPDAAIGVWFPDLPGCFSAGDDVESALKNAEEALLLYFDELVQTGRSLPKPRSVAELKQDPEARADMEKYIIALVPFRQHDLHAAE